MRLQIAALLLVSLGAISGCKRREAPSPTPRSSQLAERVRDRIQKIDPKLVVTILDEDSLAVKQGDFDMKVFLDNVKIACQRSEQECDSMIASLVANLTQAYQTRGEAKQPIERSNLRLIIKPPDWVANATQMINDGPADMRKANELVLAPFVGGLSIVYVVDLPMGMRMLTTGDLDALKLDRKQVDLIARKNLEAAFPEIKMSQMGDSGVWTNDEGNDYDASLVALPHLWKALADRLGGLVVAIPARNRVFATGPKGNLEALRKVTKMAAAEEHHSITDQLFVWSASGFRPFPH